ncbi:MAG: radical SAM protein [Thermodesulfobacteriota bacterium]|nr:radical SAM protein [Thermodesulfobacteriota bacterium]
MADNRPSIVFADEKGNIFDFEPLAMVGRSGDYLIPIEDSDIIPAPKGGQFYVLPDRHPIGMDRQTGQIITLKKNPFDPSSPAFAVAIFLAAAHTQTYLAAWEACDHATSLPLFAYTALGWKEGFVTTAVRTDISTRQDIDTFNMDTVRKGVELWKSSLPENRLVTHLAHCALVYGCPAALNLFQGREEGPLPTSPSCNARCIGCISHQPVGHPPAPQKRIKFIPSPKEIAQVALTHIIHVKDPVVSFGQGCEGEPLLAGDVIEEAIHMIRAKTDKGTINLNSNASLPEVVRSLADAGLDSLRVSMNSARPPTYKAYFRPSYDFDALHKSIYEMKKRDKFVSVNLFVFPGVTDAPKEADTLKAFIKDAGVDMVQWRNLNIDPDVYLDTLGQKFPSGIGVKRLISEIPVRCGYFNPPL